MTTDDTTKLLEEIDGYIEDLFGPSDEALEAALRDSRRGGLPEINVSPNQGRLLRLLVEIAGARRILEIGTLGGYSAIHLARGLPEDGELISLEIDEHHADVARRNVERAGLSGIVEIRVGDAHLDGLTQHGSEGSGEDALDSPEPRLRGPPGEVGAVVLYEPGVCAQSRTPIRRMRTVTKRASASLARKRSSR